MVPFKVLCRSVAMVALIFSSSATSSTSSPVESTSTSPTTSPTSTYPTTFPTLSPTTSPSSTFPTTVPSGSNPTVVPSQSPVTSNPSKAPSKSPLSSSPTSSPSTIPTSGPTISPSLSPSVSPSISPTTSSPSSFPTTSTPTTSYPSTSPTVSPTLRPTPTPPDYIVEQVNITGLEGLTITQDGGYWKGGVQTVSGKVIGVPFDADSVLVIDPVLSSPLGVELLDLTSLYKITDEFARAQRKWWGGVLHPETNHIFCIPHAANWILLIDQNNQLSRLEFTITADTATPTNEALSYTSKFCGGVYHPGSQVIYGVPCGFLGPQQYMLKIDLQNYNGTKETVIATIDDIGVWGSEGAPAFRRGEGWHSPVYNANTDTIVALPVLTSKATKYVLLLNPYNWGDYNILFLSYFSSPTEIWIGAIVNEIDNNVIAVPASNGDSIIQIDAAAEFTERGSILYNKVNRVSLKKSSDVPRLSWDGIVKDNNTNLFIGLPQAFNMEGAANINFTITSSVQTSRTGWYGGVFDSETGRTIAIPHNAVGFLSIRNPQYTAPATSTTTITTMTATTATTISSSTSGTTRTHTTTVDPLAQGSTDDGLPIAIIAGGGGGAVVLVVICLLFVCGMRTKSQSSRRKQMFKPYIIMDPLENPAFNQSEMDSVQESDSDSVSKPSYIPLATVMDLSREQAMKLLSGFSAGTFMVRKSDNSPSGMSVTLGYAPYGPLVMTHFSVGIDHRGTFIHSNSLKAEDIFPDLETLLTTACVQEVPPFPCTLYPLPDVVIKQQLQIKQPQKLERHRTVWNDDGVATARNNVLEKLANVGASENDAVADDEMTIELIAGPSGFGVTLRSTANTSAVYLGHIKEGFPSEPNLRDEIKHGLRFKSMNEENVFDVGTRGIVNIMKASKRIKVVFKKDAEGFAALPSSDKNPTPLTTATPTTTTTIPPPPTTPPPPKTTTTTTKIEDTATEAFNGFSSDDDKAFEESSFMENQPPSQSEIQPPSATENMLVNNVLNTKMEQEDTFQTLGDNGNDGDDFEPLVV